ncbi:MAG: ribokinase [Alphaproteobacteria bacterium]
MTDGVSILGIFVADLAFRSGRMPAVGETIMGSGFAMGPGGKGSNQAVAAARAGAKTRFISRLGQDSFGDIAMATWAAEGIDAKVVRSPHAPTGAAFIYVNDVNGENAIIVVPGAAGDISVADVEAAAETIRSSLVFVTQLEQPAEAALAALKIAREAGVTTVFNPAPAAPFDPAIYPLIDYITPNESETAAMVGFPVETIDDAKRAGDVLLKKGVGVALITLGEKGALFHAKDRSELVPAFHVAAVVETAGAGDAFNGGFAAALAEGREPLAAARFGCAVAGIAVTRAGTAPAMPHRAEVDALLNRST